MNMQGSELSALLDGELEPHELDRTLHAVKHDRALRATWQAYALIGDRLRQESATGRDLTAGVMARIDAEPVVLAPGNLQAARAARGHHPMLALAASVAGVAVVGWLALAGSPAQFSPLPQAEHLAAATSNAPTAFGAVPPAPTFSVATAAPTEGSTPAAVASTATRNDLSEYLLAHHTQSATFRLGNNAGHARTVNLTGSPARP